MAADETTFTDEEATTSPAQAASIVAPYKQSIASVMDSFGPCDMGCLDTSAMQELEAVHRDITELRRELQNAEPFDEEVASLVDRTITEADDRLDHWEEFTAPCINYQPTADVDANTLHAIRCIVQPEAAEQGVRNFLTALARWDPYI